MGEKPLKFRRKRATVQCAIDSYSHPMKQETSIVTSITSSGYEIFVLKNVNASEIYQAVKIFVT